MADAPRKRRWPKFLAAFAVLLVLAALWVNWQLEPTRLTALVLSRAGDALGLELTIDGTPEYALEPEPRLVLPNLVARQPGAATPILHATRAEVSLPWDTLLGGESLVITRVELDRPVLDLAALSAWQATRPASDSPFELPTFTNGLRITKGSVLGDGWRVLDLELSLPTLVPGEPAEAALAASVEREALLANFDGILRLAQAGLTSDLALEGSGHFTQDTLDTDYRLSLDGRLDAAGEPLRLRLDDLVLATTTPAVDLHGHGELTWGDTFDARLAGELSHWPETWPALPEPLGASASPLSFDLAYAGATGLGGQLAVDLARDDTTVRGTLVPADLLAWLDAPPASPLPPLEARVETPTLVVGGATLTGVTVTIEEDDAADDDATTGEEKKSGETSGQASADE